MAILPRFITMMHNNSLFFQYETQKGENHATLQATSPTIISETNYTKFEVVSSRHSGMVHIRTCYNNKYLELNPSPTGKRFVFYATADEPQEDRSHPQCTLFRYTISGNDDHVAFFHQAHNFMRPVVVYTGNQLEVGSSGLAFRFKFWDMTRLAILPKHVLFKGDDGNYLRARKNNWLQFVADDPYDWRVHHISTLVPKTGDVRLLSPRYNLYWQRLNNDWLKCEATFQNTQNSTFRPVRQSNSGRGNTIALLNTGNNRYCQRWTSGRDAGRVRASSLTVPRNAVFTVEEAVRNREISNIRYHIEDARTYDVIAIRSISQVVLNRGYDVLTQSVKFSYTEVMEKKFSSSHSWKLSYNSKLTIRVIPKIVEGEVTLSATYSGEVEWSELNRSEETITTSVNVPVPPRSRRTVTLVVGQGSMDVPYSYQQRDILMDGKLDVKDMHDGLFSGLNTFEFQYDVSEPESLPSNAKVPTREDDIVIVEPGESRDLPRMVVPRVVEEIKLEAGDPKQDKPAPMDDEDQGGEDQLAPLPMPSKL